MLKRETVSKCKFIDVCYLAESLHCYGYKLDCALYCPSKGTPATSADFHDAVDRLIEETTSRYLPQSGNK